MACSSGGGVVMMRVTARTDQHYPAVTQTRLLDQLGGLPKVLTSVSWKNPV
jgi:hypothetical protein